MHVSKNYVLLTLLYKYSKLNEREIYSNTLKIISLRKMSQNFIHMLSLLAGQYHEKARWAVSSNMLCFFLNVANCIDLEHPTHRLLFLALVWSWTRNEVAILKLPKALLFPFVDTCPIQYLQLQFSLTMTLEQIFLFKQLNVWNGQL